MKYTKFDLGQVFTTAGVAEMAENDPDFALRCRASLIRHITGDWGDLCEDDRKTNDYALEHGERLFSAYFIDEIKECMEQSDNTLWIITEADRSVTTLLFPSEY